MCDTRAVVVVLPFVPVIAINGISVFRYANSISEIILIFFSITIFVGILYRTWEITGYPTYREGVEVWNAIGFEPKQFFAIDPNYKPGRVFIIKRK